ncbi:MAG: solute carrier family 23 protein [Eubacteriales bacterium]|nr:solute carrier family 23 protein [Eubacteriales bacterium]
MKLVYDVKDRPKFKANLVFALQQLLAIIAATLLVPTLVNLSYGKEVLNQAAALLGAGVGTLTYILFTQRKSPVFLGSSFAFISPLVGAAAFGAFGIILGAVIAGLVYVIIALVVRFVGTKWVEKLLPPVVIGPTVALIGLSLCGSAINNVNNTAAGDYNLICILIGLVTFGVTVLASVKGSKGMKLIPFIIGIAAGYVLAAIFTFIGQACEIEYLKIIDFTALTSNFAPTTFSSFIALPEFTFVTALKEGTSALNGVTGFVSLLALFAPVAFVVFAEHIADHENLSTVINHDLIKDPGLHRTLLGDGVGSIVGAIFGGCPNTTYGECVGCIAITGDASVSTVILTSLLCMVLSFFTPFIAFVNTIPVCIIGGICIALYGFIAVSGLKMIQDVDLGDNRNLFVVSVILIAGVGGMALSFGKVTITSVACALILGIITNVLVNLGKHDDEQTPAIAEEAATVDTTAEDAAETDTTK